jgi:gluconokinase
MIVIVMGVTGSGKTTVGMRLAQELGCPFYDADDFHPPANVEKMRRGIALTDADREPWLKALRRRIDTTVEAGGRAVFGCSALKAAYRSLLAEGRPEVRFVHLCGPEPLIAERLRRRVGHFMNPSLLDSQFATLEPPRSAIAIEVALPLAAQVRAIRRALGC